MLQRLLLLFRTLLYNKPKGSDLSEKYLADSFASVILRRPTGMAEEDEEETTKVTDTPDCEQKVC